VFVLPSPVLAQETQQTVDTRIGKLGFELGVPTQVTVKNLYDQMDFQRACQLYIWALPLVEFGNLLDILEGTTGAKPGDLTIYTGNEQSVFLTPNATTPYIFAYLDLAKTGPVVMDIPAGGIAGSALDAWQRPLSDLGMTGLDQGKGGKYVFVGPGQEAPTAEGAFVLRSPTFGVVLFYRTLDPDQAKGEALAKRIRVYPWAQRDNPPAIRFLKPDPDKFANFTTMPRGMKYWEQLAAMVKHEPVEDRDRFFMAMLIPLGIEKGKPFQPDERQKKILTEGAFVGEAMPPSMTQQTFVQMLLRRTKLRQLRLPSPNYSSLLRYRWGTNISPISIAVSVKDDAFFYHGSAMWIHGLGQDEKNIFINSEQSEKPRNFGRPTQDAIHRAFQNQQRRSKRIYKYQRTTITVLNGKHSGRMDVGPS
jgi:hypothetical protein